jgi:hypothetical protein
VLVSLLVLLVTLIEEATGSEQTVLLADLAGTGLALVETSITTESAARGAAGADDAGLAPAAAGDPGAAAPAAPGTGAGRVSWRSMTAALAVPAVPAFAWYWAGQLVSVIGTWSQVVAVSWLVLDLTHSAVALGTITMVQTLPVLVLALPGGVLADRFPRRRVLIATQITLAAQAVALGLLVALHAATVWEVGLLSFVLGTATALNGPALRRRRSAGWSWCWGRWGCWGTTGRSRCR